MKSIFVIVLLLASLASPALAEEETCDMLFVQDAKAMIFDGSLLTLKEANPNIIFFCDRPVRTAGHIGDMDTLWIGGWTGGRHGALNV